jgi:lipoprotein-anchoring transpeptidase ErfK/SrfK
MRSRSVIAATLGALVAAGVAGASVQAASPTTAQPSADPKGQVRLSNERTLSRWAYPNSRALAYARPSGKAHAVYRMRWLTEDRLPELYLVLSEWTDPSGSRWVKIRIPKRPNGMTGWVRREALRQYTIVRTLLVVNRQTLRATLYRDGRKILQVPVGVGKASTPTPAGHFWIREKFRVRGAPVYGPYALGTSAYAPHLTDWPGGGVVGLHGTNEPGLVPGRPSHGCIRLRNKDVTRLYRLVPRGTPLHVI